MKNKQLYCHLSTSCHIFQRVYVIASWHPDNPTFTQTAISISDPYPLQLPPGALLSICLSLTGDYTQRCTVERRAPLNVRTLMQTCTNQRIFVAFLTFHPPLVSTGWRQVKWQLMCIITSLCCVLLQFVVCCCDVTERDDVWTTYITWKHIGRIFFVKGFSHNAEFENQFTSSFVWLDNKWTWRIVTKRVVYIAAAPCPCWKF